jgi:hypothetical protein
LEFEDHRPLYNWFIEQLGIYQPRQIEFARLNLDYTIMSKRNLNRLVQDGLVSGWDDPRMPTISGMRRRGYTPAAIRNFCDRIGVAKANSTVELQMRNSTTPTPPLVACSNAAVWLAPSPSRPLTPFVDPFPSSPFCRLLQPKLVTLPQPPPSAKPHP